MSTPIILVLPYPLSANRYWATRVVRNKHTGKPMALVYTTSEATEYKAAVAKTAVAAGLRLPLDGRLAMRIRLFPERPLDWAKHAQRNPDFWDDDVRCIDLGNCEKVLSDALNGVAWVDDKQLRRIHLERCEPDAGGGRAEITIGRLQHIPVARDLFTA